jgi:cytochrome b subunit of formate dehydrogenase
MHIPFKIEIQTLVQQIIENLIPSAKSDIRWLKKIKQTLIKAQM